MNETAKPKWVLAIDDEPEICEIIASYLAPLNIRTIVANSATEGIQKFRNQNFDLVITDINMPNKSGVKMIEEIRSELMVETEKAKTPVLFLSGVVDEFRQDLALIKYVHIQEKPIVKESFASLVDTILQSKKKEYSGHEQGKDEVLLLTKNICSETLKILTKETIEFTQPIKEEAHGLSKSLYTCIIPHLIDGYQGEVVLSFEESLAHHLTAVLKKSKEFSEQDVCLILEKICKSMFNKLTAFSEKRFIEVNFIDLSIFHGKSYRSFSSYSLDLKTSKGNVRISNHLAKLDKNSI